MGSQYEYGVLTPDVKVANLHTESRLIITKDVFTSQTKEQKWLQKMLQ